MARQGLKTVITWSLCSSLTLAVSDALAHDDEHQVQQHSGMHEQHASAQAQPMGQPGHGQQAAMGPTGSHQGSGADEHAGHHEMFNKEPDTAKAVNVRLEDMPLVNQDGLKQKFASEVVGDKLVALSIFYSSCTTVCPVVAAIFAEVQQKLDERLGQDVELVFLSVDPTTDTPRRLKAYSRKYDSQPGWSWLTGEKLAVDKVLNGMGLYTPDYEEHPLTVLVGDELNGHWKRFYGFPAPDQIVNELQRLQVARHQSHSHHLAKE